MVDFRTKDELTEKIESLEMAHHVKKVVDVVFLTMTLHLPSRFHSNFARFLALLVENEMSPQGPLKETISRSKLS